jgi:hypothetical protein
MERYVGLDVSLKLTAICIVDRTGKIQCDRWTVRKSGFGTNANCRLH